jgi:2-keto-4-pentenoate hydratase/2-oxohepta-3-ene-1,7-dioic acid hydratase in catechol pathway
MQRSDGSTARQRISTSFQERLMRLVSYQGKEGASRLGALADQGVVDLQTAARGMGVLAETFANISLFLAAGESALDEARKLVKSPPQGGIVALSSVHLLPPVPRPGKIIAVGLNYRDHSIESGATEPPKSPIIFAKFPNSIAGPEDAIVIPASDPQVDYEAEMAVVIGRKGKAISAEKAFDYVAGYMPLNDVSARAWQFSDKQWVRGKSPDTFCPTGPYLTTREDVPDPHSLTICARVNGVILQDSNTSKMIFRVPQLIEFISASITLEPGDIIATGTPEGVGAFRKPPIYLKPGDVVEVEIQQLGVLRNPVVAA